MNTTDKGPLFPCVISMVGRFATLSYYVQTPTGSAVFTTSDAASAFAEAWNERREFRDVLTAEPVYEISACQANEADDGTTDVSAGHTIEQADFFGIYTRDCEGCALWLADTESLEDAAAAVAALRRMPL